LLKNCWLEIGATESYVRSRLSRTPIVNLVRSNEFILNRRSLYGVSSRAFTLFELVIVIAIVATLVAILLPAVSGLRGKAEQVKCMSNMRQIGQGIVGYIAEHNQTLPGPTYSVMVAEYSYQPGGVLSRNQQQSLFAFLGPYLRLPGGGSKVATPYLCPGWLKETLDPKLVIYQCLDISIDGTPAAPFGSWAYPAVPPLKIFQISKPSSTPAITEMDQKNYPSWPTLPKGPVHHKGRNVLFFDWHMEFVPLPKGQ
jgi:prepilin-type N-terminal cleavage/methylation domain-containing protein/prepilin-type processing-associated H-X9-DG protein